MIRRNAVLAVCKRGHIIGELESEPKSDDLGFCPGCGIEIIWKCESCGVPIEGQAQAFGFATSFPTTYRMRGDFCPSCGRPFRWASRESIANHIENTLSREPGLSAGDRRALIEHLQVLRSDTEASPEIEKKQVRALEIFRRSAPKAWEMAQPLIESIATSFIKAKLGLPP